MKLVAVCLVAASVLFMVFPSQPQAQEALKLYDSLGAKVLDPVRWFGAESVAPGAMTLELRRGTKVDPLYGYTGLNLVSRSYGSTADDTDITSENTRLIITDGADVSTIVATVQVKKLAVTGCSANLKASESRARIGGFFFNTGAPTPGSAVNDVTALLSLTRSSDSTDAADVLRVVGLVAQCLDSGCLAYTVLGSESLGTARMNKRVKLRVSWDPAGNRFLFQKNAAAEVPIAYVVSDANPPGMEHGGMKRLEIQHRLANCVSGPAARGYIDAIFNNVYVNE